MEKINVDGAERQIEEYRELWRKIEPVHNRFGREIPPTLRSAVPEYLNVRIVNDLRGERILGTYYINLKELDDIHFITLVKRMMDSHSQTVEGMNRRDGRLPHEILSVLLGYNESGERYHYASYMEYSQKDKLPEFAELMETLGYPLYERVKDEETEEWGYRRYRYIVSGASGVEAQELPETIPGDVGRDDRVKPAVVGAPLHQDLLDQVSDPFDSYTYTMEQSLEALRGAVGEKGFHSLMKRVLDPKETTKLKSLYDNIVFNGTTFRTICEPLTEIFNLESNARMEPSSHKEVGTRVESILGLLNHFLRISGDGDQEDREAVNRTIAKIKEGKFRFLAQHFQ